MNLTNGAPVEPSLVEPAWWALVQNVQLDQSNAAVHMAVVRYSPITMALAEALEEYRPQDPFVQQVLADRGAYVLDPGR